MYVSYLVEVQDMNDALEEISDSGEKLHSVAYVADSQQVLLVTEKKVEEKPTLEWFKSDTGENA